MIGLVMAGGKGTRMDLPQEKLLLRYKKPVVLHVIDALRESGCFSKIIAATSDNSPKTNDLLSKTGIQIIKTSGNDYVSDLNFVLSKLDEPTLIVSGDMPLLDAQIIKQIISSHIKDAVWQSFLVTKKLLNSLNLKAEFSISFEDEECYYTGISIVNPKKISSTVTEAYTILDDKRIALNLNTKHEYELLKNT
jgi:adenosylcobinamide-phosphate guanylyltransferase